MITLRTNPGVSIIVRLGQWAYSALITIGLEETAAFVFFKSASVRDLMVSAMVDAKTMGFPYSSESSSCRTTLRFNMHAMIDAKLVRHIHSV